MKKKSSEKKRIRSRIKQRIRKKISGSPERPRLVVFRANNNISAQLVDDVNRKTIATVTSVAKKYDDFKKSHNGKVDLSRQIGVDVAETAKKLKISTVVFDRNGYQYHGRVKAVAEGARESGLQF
ncbi:50S ribosomal protein L18 [candidate division KSB1 bacterium]